MGVASFGGDIPGFYDRGLGPVIFEDFAGVMAGRVAARSPSRVLETAGGTGIVSRRLRQALPAEASLTVTDISLAMLAVAQSKFAPGEAVTIQPADACDLPFADGAFDLVACQFGMMLFPDKAKGYAEAFRVLAPGGRYLFSVWDSPAANRFGALAQETASGFFASDPPRFYDIPFGYYSLDAIRAALDGAGFTDFRAEVARIDKAVADPGAFADGLVYGNPLIAELQARAIDPAVVRNAVLEVLRRELGEPPRTCLQAIFIEARRPLPPASA